MGPSIAKRNRETPATITHSQVWLVNSRHPAARSRKNPGLPVAVSPPATASSPARARPGPAAWAAGTRRPRNADGRSRRRNHALTRYVSPSMPIPQPGPTAATTNPASTAPTVIDALITRLLSPLAC